MEKRLVTRYAMRSPEEADENQRRVEQVFSELAAAKPDSVTYIVLRLADDSFVHVSFHNHSDDEVNQSLRPPRLRTFRTATLTAARARSTSSPPSWSAHTSLRSTESRSRRDEDSEARSLAPSSTDTLSPDFRVRRVGRSFERSMSELRARAVPRRLSGRPRAPLRAP